MPILKAYVNKKGYFIRARPSDVGNITYQVDPSLWDFFDEMGYEDGSEVEWSLVKSFRLADLVYTKSEGVDDVTEDIPKLDPSKLTELTPSAVQEILEYIDSRDDLSKSKKAKIRQYIEQKYGCRSEDLASIIHDAVESVLPARSAPWAWSVEEVLSEKTTESNQQSMNIKITLKSKTVNLISGEAPRATHRISIASPTDKEGYTKWEVESKGMESWSGTIRLLHQKATLMEQLKETLSEKGYDLGKPEIVI